MYNHADQSWKSKPRFLSEENQSSLVSRLKEYVVACSIDSILIIFHGGEPLLFGALNIVRLASNIRTELAAVDCKVDFGIQTNGVLLKREHLDQFCEHDISVSLSIDGPEEIHNQFRLNHRGKPSFDKVFAALLLLKEYPSVFSGCLAVINPYFPPRKLFSFFHENGIENFNILLPDANYLTPPAGREQNRDLYLDWLIGAFDCWFHDYPEIRCTFFESIIRSFNGEKGVSDALGLGDVSMLNIETDGSYHDLDVLKITAENSSDLGMHLETDPIIKAETAEKIQLHRKLLTIEGLSSTCKSCKYVDICGGGSVPHRFSANGYLNPTIYCREMYTLISHMRNEVNRELEGHFTPYRMKKFWSFKTSEEVLKELKNGIAEENLAYLKHHQLDKDIKLSTHLQPLLHPLFYTWRLTHHGINERTPFENLDGEPIELGELTWEKFSASRDEALHIQKDWKTFQKVLGRQYVLGFDQQTLLEGAQLLREALDIINAFSPDLHREILQISPYIFMIRDADIDRDADLSFSDETLPGAIFIGLWSNGQWLPSHQVAESIIHEHLHQKLYLLQRRENLFESQDVQIYSPWPKQFREPVGAVHAVYVFVHVVEFLDWVWSNNAECEYAKNQYRKNIEYLDQCAREIDEKVVFTRVGQSLWHHIYQKFLSFNQKLQVIA